MPYRGGMAVTERTRAFLFLSLIGSIGVLGLVIGIMWTISEFSPVAPFLGVIGVVLISGVVALARRLGRRS